MIDPLRPTRRHLLYLAGPISTNEDADEAEHVRRGQDWARRFRLAGWSVVSPHYNSVELPGWTLDDYLAEDFEIIARVDGLVLLPGWKKSQGTRREVDFASARGVRVYTVEAFRV